MDKVLSAAPDQRESLPTAFSQRRAGPVVGRDEKRVSGMIDFERDPHMVMFNRDFCVVAVFDEPFVRVGNRAEDEPQIVPFR
ncbi:MAG: hypothetical protein QNI90_03880 [Dinoroseobacter sp.]|nr:hypothetical protein [Dinoroseobacter sp.]